MMASCDAFSFLFYDMVCHSIVILKCVGIIKSLLSCCQRKVKPSVYYNSGTSLNLKIHN